MFPASAAPVVPSPALSLTKVAPRSCIIFCKVKMKMKVKVNKNENTNLLSYNPELKTHLCLEP